MSTKALLYPKGFRKFVTLPANTQLRPQTFTLQFAMDLFWGMCEASVEISVTTTGGTTSSTLNGFRKDVFGNVILANQPRVLINGLTKNYTGDFAAPLHADSSFVPGTSPIGDDVTFGAVDFVSTGELYFTPVAAQPVLTISGGISAATTGWTYNWSIQDPGMSPNQISGNYVRLNGTYVPSYVWWAGAGADPATDALIDITTTQPFIWP